MTKRFAKCGCDCFDCPSYKKNIITIEDRKNCSSGWEKYLNIKLSPEKLRACDGCSINDQERKTFYVNCKIRKCAMINEIENCAYCSGFPCHELLRAHSVQQINNREEFINKTGKEISDKDYRLFIKPYTGLYHLRKIRKTLSAKDYKNYKKYQTKAKFTPFDNIPGKNDTLGKIFFLLTSIYVEQDISYARLQTIEKKREQVLRLLWAAGCFGKLSIDDGHIELDSMTISEQKINCMYNTLNEYLNDLKKYNIHGEIVPLVKKGWLTPMGGLRKKGWIIRLKFGELINDTETLVLFKNYILRLYVEYGNKAFIKFKNADLSIMEKGKI